MRCLINMAINNNWPLFQLDVNNAFLYGNLNEEVYMTLPPGYFSINDNRVCRLVKSLYGLKQAPRQWNEMLWTVLLEKGFKQSKSDYSLFIKSEEKNVFVALLVYVDDIVITENNLKEVNSCKHFLQTKFQIKDLEYGLPACKPYKTPIESKLVVTDKPLHKKDKILSNITEYQKLLGKLIYLTHTRPDISYSVHCLSQFMHSPLQSHQKLAFRVLKYLKGAPRKRIHITKGANLNLKAYVDSDWAKCKATIRSVTGFSIFMGNSLVSWKSKKQTVVARSSAEAEYRALASVTWIASVNMESISGHYMWIAGVKGPKRAIDGNEPCSFIENRALEQALDKCQLGDEVRSKEGKFDTPVTENGENWSVGQRQLVCLGRVLLKKSKVLVLDKATASVDTATDGMIHQTLNRHFNDSTVIMIAHRITSVLDSDMVLVLEQGLIEEYDSPSKLLEDKSSSFAKLVAEYSMRSSSSFENLAATK
ncbi:ribonuclease H-like domain-containing protein [Tanacetum coccineum]